MFATVLLWSVAFSVAAALHVSRGAYDNLGFLQATQWQDEARTSTYIDHGLDARSFCSEGDGWALDWKDDFDGDELDQITWSVIRSDGGSPEGAAAPVSGLGNTACRTAACRDQNVKVSNGKLVMLSERDVQDPTRFYTGAVTTKGKRGWAHNLTSGDYRVCVRAKLPSGGKGVWPAHWMLPDNGISDKFLDEGEVDIMEMINSDGNVYNTYHWMSSWPKMKRQPFNKYHKSEAHRAIMPSSWHTDFHEYAMERRGDGFSFAIDGRRVFDVPSSDGFTLSQSPFFLILNTAIGGGWPGEPTPETSLPTEHAIDYVHVVRRRV